MREIVVVSAARTPFGKHGGLLKDFSTVDLGAMAVKSVMDKIKIEPKTIDELFMGTAIIGGGVLTAARQILFKAGLPDNTPSLTLDRACCVSMTCVGIAMRNILLEEIDAAIAGGVESMSQTPLLARVRWGKRVGEITLEDPLLMRNPILNNIPIAKVTGEKALEFGVGREEQDQWALGSHQKYFAAYKAGKFADEIVPVEIPSRKGPNIKMEMDEPPRADTSIEQLRQLPTIYGSPTVTAGNAPGLNDGASAVIVMSKDKQNEMRLEALGTILAHVNAAGDLTSSVCMPAFSIRKALQKAGIQLKDLKRIEINEAFAAMPLVSTKVLSNGDSKLLEHLRSITNVNGGAVAIGHPTGASGTRLIMTLMYELRRVGGGLGAAALCGGWGQSDAVILRVD